MEFDHVIVGGGFAGYVLAARLSEDPNMTACLLETGGTGRGMRGLWPGRCAGLFQKG